jgi:AcrR family transcriptional regulator
MRELQKNARRRAILDAARALMRNAKSDDFSMPTLARRAGVSLVTPYNLFGSKSNILIEIIRKDVFDRMKEIDRLPAGTLIEWVSAAARLLAQIYHANRHFYRRAIVAVVARESAAGQRTLLALSYRMFEPSLVRLMTQKKLLPVVPADALARYLAHGVAGALQERLMERGSEERLRKSLEAAISIVFAGVCPNATRETLLTHLSNVEVPVK